MKDRLVNFIYELLEKNGIDVFYAVTLTCIIVALSYLKDIKNWPQLPMYSKGLISSAIITAITFTIISLLRLIGVVNF